MARKVFISFLGYSNYSECVYVKDGYKSPSVRYIQEATLIYLSKIEKWDNNDVAYILLTNGAKDVNWVDNGHKDHKTGDTIEQLGLRSRLNSTRLPMKIIPLEGLPDGNNEAEIWEIFCSIYKNLCDGDELYFDLTHGFRYLPMLALVLGNYSKFLKNITVKHISYGNYEGRNRYTNEAPIIDLKPLSTLQDWTFAAGQYLDSGNVNKFIEMKDKVDSDTLLKIIDLLTSVIKERQTCRGLNILNSDNLSLLKKVIDEYVHHMNESSTISKDEPFKPIILEVKRSLDVFDEAPNYMNGFYAAQWCSKNGLYQQAITMLFEGIFTMFCIRHDWDVRNKSIRDAISVALNIQVNHKQNRRDKWPSFLTDDQTTVVETILSDDWVKSETKNNNELIHIFKEISDYRNNFNHAGFNENTPTSDEIESKIVEFANRIIQTITQNISAC